MSLDTMLYSAVTRIEQLGWERYLGREDIYHWRTRNSNRYVDICLPYVDIYVYKNEEKYRSWLSVEELNAFNALTQLLDTQKKDNATYEEILSFDLPQ